MSLEAEAAVLHLELYYEVFPNFAAAKELYLAHYQCQTRTRSPDFRSSPLLVAALLWSLGGVLVLGLHEGNRNE